MGAGLMRCLFAVSAYAFANIPLPTECIPASTVPAKPMGAMSPSVDPNAIAMRERVDAEVLAARLKLAHIRARHVPVLLYHHVCGIKNRMNVTVADFEHQMAFLSENGYTSVSVDQIRLALDGKGDLPAKPVAITFDDGWRCEYTHAVPIMAKYGFHATFFIVTNQADGHTFMSWAEDRDLLRTGNWIGSHTVDHAFLTKLDDFDLTRDLVASKRKLEDKLGIEVNEFAYPYGAYNEAVVKAVRKAGYAGAVIVGESSKGFAPTYEIRRVQVSYGDDLDRFRSLLGIPREVAKVKAKLSYPVIAKHGAPKPDAPIAKPTKAVAPTGSASSI
jgi:peptidoglycan/xylan/chitin deacetylase (PgdA/CDA1 family)